jgi:hypothetical protein
LEVNGPFQSGINTLDLAVNNAGSQKNPSGLRVEIGFATPPIRAGLPQWRGTAKKRQAWQDKLRGRVEQYDSLITALQPALDVTEEQTLALLRDALVRAFTVLGAMPLFTTGFSETSLLADGGIDPHWFMVVTQDQGSPPSEMPSYATNHPLPPGWFGPSGAPRSRWISPHADESKGEPVSQYTFRTKFNLSGFDPAAAQAWLNVGVDHGVISMFLNGHDIGAGMNLGQIGAGSLTALPSITQWFVEDLNVLDVIVQNYGAGPLRPLGLRVECSSDARIPVTADWVSQRLLIDVQADASEKTTRLAQATEMMQARFCTPRSFARMYTRGPCSKKAERGSGSLSGNSAYPGGSIPGSVTIQNRIVANGPSGETTTAL